MQTSPEEVIVYLEQTATGLSGVVYVLRTFYKGLEETLRGLYRTEASAIMAVRHLASPWEGRLLWWPQGYGGRWTVQLLLEHRFEGRRRFLGKEWVIEPWEVT